MDLKTIDVNALGADQVEALLKLLKDRKAAEYQAANAQREAKAAEFGKFVAEIKMACETHGFDPRLVAIQLNPRAPRKAKSAPVAEAAPATA